jgi:hypothetical protein
LAAEEQLHSLVARDWLKNQFEHRHLSKCVRNEPGNQRRRDGIHDAQRQSLAATANPIEGYRPNPLLTVRDRSEFGSDVAAERCQATIFSIAIDQRSAQFLFEPLYRAGERGLRYATPHGGFGEIEGVRQVQEISNLVEFHCSSFVASSSIDFRPGKRCRPEQLPPYGNYTRQPLENFVPRCYN